MFKQWRMCPDPYYLKITLAAIQRRDSKRQGSSREPTVIKRVREAALNQGAGGGAGE